MTLKSIRIALYGAIAVLVVAGVGLYAASSYFGANGHGGQLAMPTSLIGGPFTMTDQTGKTVTEKDFLGKPTLMFFGYTFCPDVCPTTLAEATGWLQTLGPDADKLQIVFVTVDPERDTPAKLAEYLSAFDPRIRGLSGTPEQTKQIIKDYRVYARKVVQKDTSDYLMDHTAAVYLMDKNGQFVGAISYQEPEDKAVAKLKDLLGRSATS
jgi:protein SCO1/2